MIRKSLGKSRLRGWLVQQCPTGRKKFYWYLYWRCRGRLHKEYVRSDEVEELRSSLRKARQERQAEKRRERLESERERLENQSDRLSWREIEILRLAAMKCRRL